MNPLRPSPSNVKSAASLLPLLITFVAPGFFEPNDLGSGRLNIFELTTANGIDPSRYNNTIIIKVSVLIIFSDI
jgi:hypothetical protein